MTPHEFDVVKKLIKPIIKRLLPVGWKYRFSKKCLMLILYPDPEAWNIVIELAYVDYSTTDGVYTYLKGILDYEVDYLARQLSDDTE